METWQLHPLKMGDLLIITFGNDGFVPYQVVANEAFELVYDPVKQGVLAGPMVGQGATPSSSQSAAYNDNLLFALSSSVTSINGVTDIFNIQKDFEMLQFWFGISPRHIRVWAKQPYSQFTTSLDNNVIPSSSYYDEGYFDGYDSPYNMPAPITEQLSLKNLSLNWTLCNPLNGSATAPMTWNPRLNFYINRFLVNPVKKASIVRDMVLGRRTAKRVTIGDPTTSVAYDETVYGGASPIPISYALRDDFEAALKSAGYT
jgi:hypothetical protein